MANSSNVVEVLEPKTTPKKSSTKRRTSTKKAASVVKAAVSEKNSDSLKVVKSRKKTSITTSTSKARNSSVKSTEEDSEKAICAEGAKGSKIQQKKTGHNKSLGKRGEDAAARFLINHGYTILSRNYTCKFGEADIVAKTPDTIVFVEVKTRTDEDKGMPEEAITSKKRSKYEKIAISYLRDYEDVDIAVRFDVIGILVVSSDRAIIRHHINAFGVG